MQKKETMIDVIVVNAKLLNVKEDAVTPKELIEYGILRPLFFIFLKSSGLQDNCKLNLIFRAFRNKLGLTEDQFSDKDGYNFIQNMRDKEKGSNKLIREVEKMRL